MSKSLKLSLFLLTVAGPAFAGFNPFVEQAWAPHGATAQARYGGVVAPAGDVNGDGFSDVLVTAPKDEGPAGDAGKVFLYLGSGTGLAASPAWSWSANQAGALTGTSAAAAGDVNGDGYGDVVIGTPQWTTSGPSIVTMAGKISVFHGGPAGLPASPTYERLAPTPTANAKFGFAVATAGSINGDLYADVLVGAPYHSVGGLTARGAVFVFHGGAAGLAAAPALTLLGAQAGANFGKSVSPAGDVTGDGYPDVVVGAPFALFGGTKSGTATLYRGSAAGLTSVDTPLGSDLTLEEFGAAVANAGDVDGDGYADVLVGHPGYSSNRGRFELYRGGPGGIPGPAEITLEGQDDGARLGAAVATLGDLNADGYADFAVGAPYDSVVAPGAQVLVYFGGPLPLAPPVYLFSNSAQARSFGFSIGTAGDIDADGFSEFVVGDPAASVVPAAAEGTATLFELVRSAPVTYPGWPVAGNDPGTRRGEAVAISPGMDQSGYAFLVTGEPLWDYGFDLDSGYMMLLGSGADGPGTTFFSQYSQTGGDHFGAEFADAGDVDRDGFSDVLVASPTHSAPSATEAGRVQLIRGSENGPLPAQIALDGDQALARVGGAISGRGDVDGDGYHDVLIGAAGWDAPGLADCGKVWLLYGSPTGFRAGMWTAQGTAAGQGFGTSVSIGDIDADGYGDVLVGSVSSLLNNPPSGKVAAYYGGPGGAAASAAWEVASGEPSWSFGLALAAVGDVNDDGVCDIGIGAPAEAGTGRAYVLQGSPSRARPRLTWSYPGGQANALFGAAIRGGGDVDGDGIGDFVIGEPNYDNGQTDEGRLHLVYGNRSRPPVGWTFESDVASQGLGASLATLSDVNKDGFADIAAGAPGSPSVVGRTYLFAGGGGLGLWRSLPLQKDLSASPYNYHPLRIGAAQAAGISFPLRSAEGRARVQLQLEVLPLNQPFTAQATKTVGPFDTGNPGPGGSVVQVLSTLDLPWMGVTYKVRGRSRSASPFFPSSRWFRPEAHASGDYDVYRGGTEVAVDRTSAGTLLPRLAGIAPNPVPASAGTRIAFELPRATGVVIDVFDVRGARIRRVLDEPRPAGAGNASWDGADEHGSAAPAGLYFVRLTAEGEVDRERLVRLP